MKRSLIYLLQLCACACSGPNAYLVTAGKFAGATHDAVTAMQGVTGFRGALCHQAAQFDYAAHRLAGPVLDPATQQPISPLDYETTFPYDGATWSKRCVQTDASDAVITRALQTIGAYADAVGTVTGADFSGSDVTALANSAVTSATAAGSSSASAIAQALVDPITKVATQLKQSYAAHKTAELAARSAPDIDTLLTGVGRYLNAINEEARLTRKNLADTLALADRVVQPGGALAYTALATRWKHQVDTLAGGISASRDSLQSIADAEKKLVAAAGNKDAVQLADVLGDVTSLLGSIAAIREAMAGKAGN